MTERTEATGARTLDHPLLPPPSSLRWIVLVVLSFASFASSYLYDCIGPLAKLLSAQLHYSNSDIGLLQAVCSLPNLVMVLVGGIIIDRIGAKKAAAIFAFVCLAGAVVTALSPRLGIMVAGRLLYGLGSGSLSVAVNTGIAQWFRGLKMSFVFGVSLTIQRLGSLASQTSPAWAHAAYAWWRTPLLLALLFGVLCLLCTGAYWLIEGQAARRYALGFQGTGRRFVARDLLDFGQSYWLVVLLCVTFYSGIFPFQTFAQKFFIEAHRASPYHASVLVGIPTLIAMVLTPLCGLLADRIGRRCLLMIVGTALLAPTYLLLAYGHMSLYVPVAMMGLAFALVPAVMWPAVMLIVPHQRLGTAFGLMSLIQSVGLTGFNFLIGWANDASRAGEAHPAGYQLGMWLFSGSLALALVVAYLLRRRELGPEGHGLETPSGLRAPFAVAQANP